MAGDVVLRSRGSEAVEKPPLRLRETSVACLPAFHHSSLPPFSFLPPSFPSSLPFYFLEAGPHVARPGLEIAVPLRMTLDSWPSCLSLLSPGITACASTPGL